MASACPEKLTLDCRPASDNNAPESSTMPATKTTVPATPLSTVGEGDWQVVVKGRRTLQAAARPTNKQDTNNPTLNNCKGDASATDPWTENDMSYEKIQQVRKLKAELEKQLVPSISSPPTSSPKTVRPSSSAPSSLSKLKKQSSPLRALRVTHPQCTKKSGRD